VDVQGPEVVKPYTGKVGVTFPVAVDRADVFGAAFGLKAIPVTFLVDEVGIIRLRGGGPEADLLKRIESILEETPAQVRAVLPQLPAARSRSELKKLVAKNPSDWRSRLALARAYDAEGRYADAVVELEAAQKLDPKSAEIHVVWGLVLLHKNQKNDALAELKHARGLDPDNWRIRKQIWAIEHPDKFYSGDSPDFGWQKEQLEREKIAAP